MSKCHTISFPHIGDYHVPISAALRRVFPKHKITAAPPMTRETIELGARHSPDYVCSPFKYNLGNYIQALEAGADVLFQTGLGCRFGYYGELQEQILRDLGYDFRFIWLSRNRIRPDLVCSEVADLESPLSAAGAVYQFAVAAESIHVMDVLGRYVRENMAFEKKRGDFERTYRQFLDGLGDVSTIAEVRALRRYFKLKLKSIPVEKPESPFRVGIVGDLYSVMEPFSNSYIERRLSERGVSISRDMSVTFLLFGKPGSMTLRQARGYLRFPVGANGLDSVAQSKRYGSRGYDGVIHLKAFGCTPELNVAPSLINISRDYEIPLLQMSFDSQTGAAGVETRIEAFIDMIEMRRGREHGGKLQSWG